MIIKALLFVVVLIIPFFPGILLIGKKKQIGRYDLIESYITGQITMWGVFQLIGVLMIRLKLSFSLLYYVFISLTAFFSILGIVKLSKSSLTIRIPKIHSVVLWVILILTIGIVIYQMTMYAVGMHRDGDDARWIAQANDAVTYNSMFLINPSTGENIGFFAGDMVRDSISPWPMYLAVISALTGIRPIIIAHTVYAPVLLLISYLVFTRMGHLLFKRIDEQIIFIFLVSVITLFFSGNGNTSAEFSLIRIWQGKAVVAAIMIPAVFSQFLAIQKEDTVQNWLLLFMMSCASCLMSGMGIVISIIMVGGFGLYLLLSRRWKRIPLWLLCLLPSVFFEMLYQHFS